MKLKIFILLLCPFLISSAETNQSTKIKYLHVLSQIQSRFAITLITSEVINLHNVSKEIFFTAQLPDAAFISNFSMKIDDKIIFGDVKEKEKAKQDYEKAVLAGKSAGLVSEKPRETNSFQISVNVAAHGKVAFNLTYQEMLKRTHGVYKHVVNLQPQQEVEDMIIDVFINEQGEMINLKVPKFAAKIGEKTNRDLQKLEDQQDVQIKQHSSPQNSFAYITYKPTDKSGQFVVLYDVKRDSTGGRIEVMNGYFVHFFAPSGLERGTKNIVFVLDKSGSMSGRKFEQTKDAMKTILNELHENDRFNILMFSDGTELWKMEPVMATSENRQKAVEYIQSAEAMGGTNIFDALLEGVNLLSSGPRNSLTAMLIFLTDGEATVGEMNSETIVSNISAANRNKNVVIHSLAFGNDADFKLVQRISIANSGLARKVYEDSDADLQLTGFFNEISSPLLTNVNIKYLNETVDVDSLVQDNSYNYYDGGEFVVVGKLAGPTIINPLFNAEISASAQSGPVQFRTESRDLVCPKEFVIIEGDIMVPCCSRPYCPPFGPYSGPELVQKPLLPASTIGGFIERMWAYQTIKKLLKSAELEADNKEIFRAKALDLSLKYKFVTELTSMVVVQPDQENATVIEEPEAPAPIGGYQQAYAMPMHRSAPGLHGLQMSSSIGGYHQAYDYNSVMHYDKFAFAINKSRPSIIRIPASIDPLPWPQGKVYYQITDNDFTDIEKEFILSMMEKFEDLSCVRFIKQTHQPTYVHIRRRSDQRSCSSYVGYKNSGSRELFLNSDCMNKNGILHELMHALGFYHEHNREDRDRYVTIDYDNIDPLYYKNFIKRTYLEHVLFGVEYDFNSIMHFDKFAFAINKSQPTIVSINGEDVRINGLSIKDKVKINKLYQCDINGKISSKDSAISVNQALVDPPQCQNISSLMLYIDMTGDDRQLCWNNYHFVANLIASLVKKRDINVFLRVNTQNGLRKAKMTVTHGAELFLPLLKNVSMFCNTNSVKPSKFHNVTQNAEKSDAIMFFVGATVADTMKPTVDHYINNGKTVYIANLRQNQSSANDLLWRNLSPQDGIYITSVNSYSEVSKHLRCP